MIIHGLGNLNELDCEGQTTEQRRDDINGRMRSKE
jgi:hypothetical protein